MILGHHRNFDVVAPSYRLCSLRYVDTQIVHHVNAHNHSKTEVT